MMQIDAVQADAVAGGGWFGIGMDVAKGLYAGISAGGATLRNYYGDEMTLEIFAAGNMGA